VLVRKVVLLPIKKVGDAQVGGKKKSPVGDCLRKFWEAMARWPVKLPLETGRENISGRQEAGGGVGSTTIQQIFDQRSPWGPLCV